MAKNSIKTGDRNITVTREAVRKAVDTSWDSGKGNSHKKYPPAASARPVRKGKK